MTLLCGSLCSGSSLWFFSVALFAVILLCGSLHCDSLCVLFSLSLCVLGSSRRVYPLANTEGSLDVSLALTFASKLFEISNPGFERCVHKKVRAYF